MHHSSSRNYVVYTCITGGYDNLSQPSVVNPHFDYICFVDHEVAPAASNGVWQLRQIPKVSPDKVTLSRYPKLCPHELLPEYEYSLYIDANINILHHDFYDAVLIAIERKLLWCGVKHPAYDCIYTEAKFILLYGRLMYHQIIPVLRFLHKEGFPTHHGLFENNIMLRRHNDAKVIEINNLWWEMFLRFCHRDQMSLFYCFWKVDFTPSLLIDCPSLDYPSLSIIRHNPSEKQRKKTEWRIRINTVLLKLLPLDKFV